MHLYFTRFVHSQQFKRSDFVILSPIALKIHCNVRLYKRPSSTSHDDHELRHFFVEKQARKWSGAFKSIGKQYSAHNFVASQRKTRNNSHGLNMKLFFQLLLASLAVQPSIQCPNAQRHLSKGWEPDNEEHEARILQSDMCTYYLQSKFDMTWNANVPSGMTCCLSSNSNNVDGSEFATIMGTPMAQTVTFAPDSGCMIKEVAHFDSGNCVDPVMVSPNGNMYTFVSDNGFPIVYVSFIVECPCICPDGGCGGDPHVQRWNGDRYYFNGEGDIVLFNSPDFDNGKGLDVHIRTTIEDWYSFIESTAVRVGDSTLEISKGNTGKFLVDGVEHTDDELPMTIGDYKFERVAHLKDDDGEERGVLYMLHLNGHSIGFKVLKRLMSVDISVGSDDSDFKNSVGLMGSYPSGDLLGRNGEAIAMDGKIQIVKGGREDDVSNAMGFEWQVRDSDPKLFSEVREPQWPQPPKLPSVTQISRRSLRASSISTEAAHEACQGKSAKDFNFCVADVLALGDVDAALSW